MKTHLIVAAALGLASLGIAEHAANAERRTNDLSKQVAVRHRRLLVKNRFEFTPLFESTINADFRHIIGGGAKLEYHLGDMLSFGVVGVASASINTALVNKVVGTLPDSNMPTDIEPTKQEYLQHLNSMPFHGAAYVSLTPWYGKLAAFSQAYVAFDFYFQAGVAFAQLTNSCDKATVCTDDTQGKGKPMMQPDGTTVFVPDGNPKNDLPLNGGTRAGLYLGGGIHVFLNDFLALDLTVRDYAFSDNPSGADFNADGFVGKNSNSDIGDDNRFINHLFFGLGLSIMFPTTVVRTP